MGGVVILLALCVFLLLIPGVRASLLSFGLSRASASLPGRINVGRASWLSLGAVRVTDLVWADGADTLLAADEMSFSVDLWPLVRGDLVIEDVVIREITADIPAIVSRFPTRDAPVTAETRGRFPREGSLPRFPSLSVGHLSIVAPLIRLTDTRGITGLAIEGDCDFTHENAPALHLRRFSVQGPEGTWGVDSLAVDLDLGSGRVHGGGRGHLAPDWPIRLSVVSSAADSVSIVLVKNDALGASEPTGLVGRALLERRGLTVDAINFDVTIRFPATAELAGVPFLASRLRGLPSLDAGVLTSHGTLQLKPHFLARATCEVSQINKLQRGHFEIGYEGEALSVTDATFDFSDLPIDQLRLDARVPLGTDEPSSAIVIVDAASFSVGVAALIDRRAGIDAQLGPVVLENHRLEPSQLSVPHSARSHVRFAPATGELTVDNLRIEGAAGEIDVNGRLDRLMAGTYTVSCRWREAPELLLGLLDLSPQQSDSLRTLWRSGEPCELHVTGTTTGGSSRATTTSGSFTLPGPRILVAIQPRLASVEDLGSLKGHFVLATQTDASGTRMELTADMDSTAWIDSSIVHIRRSRELTEIDTVGIAALGLIAGIRGDVEPGRYNIVADIAVLDSSLLGRFVPGTPWTRGRATAHLTGTPGKPDIDAFLEASIEDDGYRIPRVTGKLELDEHGTSVTLDAPQGLWTSFVALDSASLDYTSTHGARSFLPARLSLTAGGRDVEFFHSSLLDTVGGLTITVDDLRLVVAQRDLRSTRPFRVRQQPNRIAFEDIDLAGSLGALRVDGTVGENSTNLTCDLAIDFPKAPPSLNVPEHLWPEGLDVHLRAKEHDVSAHALVRGFSLAHGRRSTLRVTIESGADSLRANVVVADDSRSLLEATAILPATTSVYPPSLVVDEGPLLIDVSMTQYPLAFYFLRGGLNIPDEEVARLDGRIAIGGTTAAPVGHATARMAFPDWPKLSVYELEIEARIGSGTANPSPVSSDFLIRASHALSAESPGNIVAAMSLKENGEEVLFGALGHPLVVTLSPLAAMTPEGGEMHAVLKADALPLDRFDPVLPANVTVEGSCKIDFVASGPVHDPNLAGTIVASAVNMSVAEQIRLVARGNVGIAGTASTPDVRGEFTITSGVMQIPEELRRLHPTEGRALLLADTSGITAPSPLPQPQSPLQADSTSNSSGGGTYDVTIGIPSAFYVRGRGLELELSGNLRVEKKHAKPAVTGELRAVRGTLVYLGRSLKLDRGTVTFYGEDEMNPAMDVALSTRVNDTQIQILIAGTARQPRLLLTSEPYMQEKDIISVLLFGTTFNDLNDDQAGHLHSRTTEMMAALGAAELQKNISGIDVVSYLGSDKTDESGTLTVGKYLSPDVLLSYVYAIDDQSSSFASLEYFLKGNFRLNTVYGKRNQTGLGIGWARDY